MLSFVIRTVLVDRKFADWVWQLILDCSAICFSCQPLLSDCGHWFWIGELCAHKWTTCNDAKWWWLPVSRSAPPSNTQKRTQAAHYFHHPSFFLREKYQFLDQTFSHRCIGSGPPHTYYRFGMTTTLVERKTWEDYFLATCVGWYGGLYIFHQGLLTQTYWLTI